MDDVAPLTSRIVGSVRAPNVSAQIVTPVASIRISGMTAANQAGAYTTLTAIRSRSLGCADAGAGPRTLRDRGRRPGPDRAAPAGARARRDPRRVTGTPVISRSADRRPVGTRCAAIGSEGA